MRIPSWLCLSLCLLVPVAPATTAREISPAEKTAPATDRLGVPGPVRLGGRTYALAWTSHPGPHLFKQEYIPAGQQVERYTDMLLIDVRPNTTAARETAAQMVRTLEQRKATDAMTNYQLLQEKEGSGLLLDFLISARDAQGKIIVEWNAYRYSDTPDGRGSVMVGLSRRAYGDAQARAFLAVLKQDRLRDREALGELEVPIRVDASS